MRHRILGFLFLMPLFLLHAPQVAAQTAVPYAYYPPPADWYELEFWNCNPSNCDNSEVAYTGSVTTTITGLCYNQYVPLAGETAIADNCVDPVLLDAFAYTKWRFKREGPLFKTYEVESVYAEADVYDDYGILLDFGYYENLCDGTSSSIQAPPGLC